MESLKINYVDKGCEVALGWKDLLDLVRDVNNNDSWNLP